MEKEGENEEKGDETRGNMDSSSQGQNQCIELCRSLIYSLKLALSDSQDHQPSVSTSGSLRVNTQVLVCSR